MRDPYFQLLRSHMEGDLPRAPTCVITPHATIQEGSQGMFSHEIFHSPGQAGELLHVLPFAAWWVAAGPAPGQ